MEITTKGMAKRKNTFNKSNDLTTYFTNYQKRQLVDFLRKYLYIISVKNCLKCKFQKITLKLSVP